MMLRVYICGVPYSFTAPAIVVRHYFINKNHHQTNDLSEVEDVYCMNIQYVYCM